MTDLVVTVPRNLWTGWIDEGDAVGEPETYEEWGFFLGWQRPPIEPGDRLYVVAHDRLRGYAPVTRVAFFPSSCPDHPDDYSDAMELGLRAALTKCEICRGRVDGLDIRPNAAGRWAIGRKGGAVAVTLPEHVRGFQGFRERWWNIDDERPFPAWQTEDLWLNKARAKAKREADVADRDIEPDNQGSLF